MKSIVLCSVLLAASFVAQAGSVISWDAEKASGAWSDGSNWVGGVAPAEGDAAMFTVDAAADVSVGIDQDLSIANVWVYGGGKVTLKEAGATQVMVTGNSGYSAL